MNDSHNKPALKSQLPLICTIVLAYDATETIFECIESVLSQNNVSQRVCIVQNGGDTSLIDRVMGRFPSVHVLWNGENVGAAAGRNLGIRWSKQHRPDYFFFLDNDATLDSNALQELVLAARKHPDAGFLGALFFEASNPTRIYSAGAFLLPPLDLRYVRDIGSMPYIFEVDVTGTGALLVPQRTVASVGELDEMLFLSDEDTEWCLRARDVDLKTYIVRTAFAYHDPPPPGKKLSPRHLYYRTRNRLIVAHKYGQFSSLLESRVVISLARRFLRILFSNTLLSVTRTSAYLLAIFHFLRGRLGKCPEFLDKENEAFLEVSIQRRIRGSAFWKVMKSIKSNFPGIVTTGV